MDADLKTIVTRFEGELQTWLDQPSPTRAKIDQLRTDLAGLKAELGAGVLGEAIKSLEKADASAKRMRQREAADALAEACRPLGVILEAKEPPKRARRKPKTKPAESGRGGSSMDHKPSSPPPESDKD